MNTNTNVPSIPMESMHSSTIAEVGYDPDSQTLAVRFHASGDAKAGSGPLYHYAGVPEETYNAMRAAPSLGKFHAASIKGTFDQSKIDETPAEKEA